MAVRHDLPFTVVIGPDGNMTAAAGEDYDGMDRMEARTAVIEELTEQGLLVKTEDYVHNVGYSQRSHVPIEPYLSEQWFLKYPSVEPALTCVTGSAGASPAAVGAMSDFLKLEASVRKDSADEVSAAAPGAGALPQMRFYPDRWVKTYTHWMENLRDWCISRQLWWGHRVPVWTKSVVMQSYHAMSQHLPKEVFDSSIGARPEFLRGTGGLPGMEFAWPSQNSAGQSKDLVNVLRFERLEAGDSPLGTPCKFQIRCSTTDERIASQLEQHGFTQDPDVLDTWFSSWLWPFATMGWPDADRTPQRNSIPPPTWSRGRTSFSSGSHA